MGTIEIVNATQEHIDALKPRLRASDIRECKAVGDSAAQILQRSFETCPPKMCWAVLSDGEPLFAVGCSVQPERPGRGGAWILGSDALVEAKTELKMLHSFYIGHMLEHFEVVESVVAKDNEKAIRYAKRCGFEIDETKTYSVNGVDFYYISISRGE
jgi:hypothetical protein